MAAHFVDADNVRMLQTRGGDRLRAEPLHELRRRVRSQTQHLDRHNPVQAPLPRFEDHAHAAFTDFLQQLIVAELSDQ